MASNTRWFQWIAGDKKGQIMVFDKIDAEEDNVYISFKDGSRINENLVAPLNQRDLTGKMMAEIDHPDNCWKFKEEWVGRMEEVWVEQDETNPGNKVCVQPFVPGKKVTKLDPPRPTPKTHSVFGIINNKPEPTPQPIPQPVQEIVKEVIPESSLSKSDPVYILMSKAKKIDTDITMGMVISLPPKNLYEIAKESFDEGDDKFITYIVDELTVNEIKDALKVAIKEMYEEKEEGLKL